MCTSDVRSQAPAPFRCQMVGATPTSCAVNLTRKGLNSSSKRIFSSHRLWSRICQYREPAWLLPVRAPLACQSAGKRGEISASFDLASFLWRRRLKGCQCLGPAQLVAVDEDDTTQNPATVSAWLAMAPGEKGHSRSICSSISQDKFAHSGLVAEAENDRVAHNAGTQT